VEELHKKIVELESQIGKLLAQLWRENAKDPETETAKAARGGRAAKVAYAKEYVAESGGEILLAMLEELGIDPHENEDPFVKYDSVDDSCEWR
jgi:hypothetical protein